jgi:predicted SnoaL-like aldol condensation-catalyzing enzyme
MRRSALLLFVAILATVTGAGLIGTGLVLTRPAQGSGQSRAATDAVTAYIAAVNAALRTGAVDALDQVVSDDFVEHGPAVALGADRTGLERYLRALRTTYPDLRLTIDEVVSTDTLVSVRLTSHADRVATFPGAPRLARLGAWTTVELFRLERGKIAEHWAGDNGVDLYEPLSTRSASMPIDGIVTIAVARMRAAGPETGWVTLPGAAVVVVEDGQVSARAGEGWRIDREGSRTPVAVPPSGEVTLDPGDVAFLPAAGSEVHTSDQHAAFLVAVAISAATFDTIDRNDQNGATSEPARDGLVETLLGRGSGVQFTTSGMLVDPLARLRPPATADHEAGIGFGLVVLRPGTDLRLDAFAGMRGIAVETGAIALDPFDGRAEIELARHSSEATPAIRVGGAVALGTGDAVVVPPDVPAELRNTGDTPAVLLLVVAAHAHAAVPSSSPTPSQTGRPSVSATAATGDDPVNGHPS